MCYLSDDWVHDTSFVCELQRDLMNYIKLNHSAIKWIECFSDECTPQHKN